MKLHLSERAGSHMAFVGGKRRLTWPWHGDLSVKTNSSASYYGKVGL